MRFFFSFRFVLSVIVALFFAAGSYLGYLSALVQIDELQFLQEVEARTDLENLRDQLARAKSIADARRRAYIRSKNTFIEEQIALETELIAKQEQQEALQEQLRQQQLEEQERREKQQQLEDVQSEILQLEQQLDDIETVDAVALQEEEEDLQFFDDQVDVVQQLVDRQELEQAFEQDAAGRPLKRISGNLSKSQLQDELQSRRSILLGRTQYLRQLLDKQREIIVQRQEKKQTFNFWEANAKNSPDFLEITVNDKAGLNRKLDPQHATQIATAFSIMPSGFNQRIKRLYIVYGDEKMRRGMAGVGVIFMKGEELDFFRVLVHESGHIWDLHREVSSGAKSNFFDGKYRLFQEDPSVTYYEFSWTNNFERVDDPLAFASGYSLSDPFEAFAEEFALYVLQGDTFRKWAETNRVMALKYAFMKDIYNGREFRSTATISARPYDVTQLPVDYTVLLDVNAVAAN